MMGYLPTSAFHLFGTHFLCNLNVWDVFPLSTHAWHFLGFVKCPRNPLIAGVGFVEFVSFKSLKFIYLFTPPGRAKALSSLRNAAFSPPWAAVSNHLGFPRFGLSFLSRLTKIWWGALLHDQTLKAWLGRHGRIGSQSALSGPGF
jgi:hypothetical protein